MFFVNTKLTIEVLERIRELEGLLKRFQMINKRNNFYKLIIAFTLFSCSSQSNKAIQKDLFFEVGFSNELLKIYDDEKLVKELILNTDNQSGLASHIVVNSFYDCILLVSKKDSVSICGTSKRYNRVNYAIDSTLSVESYEKLDESIFIYD